MEYLFPTLFLALLLLVLLLNLFTLPANWIMIGLIMAWALINPQPGKTDFVYFSAIVGLSVFGEIVEFVAQAWGAKRYGSTTTGMFAGLLGAIVGAILGLPFLFGLGALFGALLGAWGFCYVAERLRGRSAEEAWKAAKGALYGRFFGIALKCGIGAVIVMLTYRAIWPGLAAAMPPVLPPVSTF